MGALTNNGAAGDPNASDGEPIATPEEAAAAMAQVLADIALLTGQMKNARQDSAASRLIDASASAGEGDELVFEGDEPDELVFVADDDSGEEEDGVRARLVKLGEERAAGFKPARDKIWQGQGTHIQTADEIDELTLMDLKASFPAARAPGLSEDVRGFGSPASLAPFTATSAEGGGSPIVDLAKAGALEDLADKRKRDRD